MSPLKYTLYPLLALAVGACGTTPPSPTPAPEPPRAADSRAQPPPLDPGVCLPGEGLSATERSALAARIVSYCEQDGVVPRCFAIDTDTGRMVTQALPPDVDIEPTWNAPFGPVRATSGGDAEACPSPTDPCVRLRLPPGASNPLGDVSPNGRRAVVVFSTPERDEKMGLIYSLSSGKVVSSFRANPDPIYPCARAVFLGDDRLLVSATRCDGSAGHSWIADMRGRHVAFVGGDARWPLSSMDRVQTAEDRWAFRDDLGRQIVIHDTKSGAVVHRIDLTTTAAPMAQNAAYGASSGGHLFGASSGELVVLIDAMQHGPVVMIDPATGRITRVWEGSPCAAL